MPESITPVQPSMRTMRIGVDIGGTKTEAVAIDGDNHVLHALEFVVLDCPESYFVVEAVSTAGRPATAMAADQRAAAEEPLTRDTDGLA